MTEVHQSLEVLDVVLDWLARHRWWLAGAGALLALGVVVIWRWWRRQVVEALRDRVAVDLVPSTTFDPQPEAVGWFARQVAQVSAAAGMLPRRAAAVRVRLRCEKGQLVYRLEGPQRAAAVLQVATYPDVEVVDAGTEQQWEVPQLRLGARTAGKGGRR